MFQSRSARIILIPFTRPYKYINIEANLADTFTTDTELSQHSRESRLRGCLERINHVYKLAESLIHKNAERHRANLIFTVRKLTRKLSPEYCSSQLCYIKAMLCVNCACIGICEARYYVGYVFY